MIPVEIYLAADYRSTPPRVRVSSSRESLEFVIDQHQTKLSFNMHFASADCIDVHFLNKDDADDNVIEIQKLILDGIDQQHHILAGTFRPIYNPDWLRQQQEPPPEYFQPGTHMRHLGYWRYGFRLPVWKHMMELWIKDDRPSYS